MARQDQQAAAAVVGGRSWLGKLRGEPGAAITQPRPGFTAFARISALPAVAGDHAALAAPGTRISARLPTAAERRATRAGMWVPVLAVAQPGWPEQLYPADRAVVVVPAPCEKPAS